MEDAPRAPRPPRCPGPPDARRNHLAGQARRSSFCNNFPFSAPGFDVDGEDGGAVHLIRRYVSIVLARFEVGEVLVEQALEAAAFLFFGFDHARPSEGAHARILHAELERGIRREEASHLGHAETHPWVALDVVEMGRL